MSDEGNVERLKPWSLERLEDYCRNHPEWCRCDMCNALAARKTEHKEREMEKRITSKKLVSEESSFTTNAKNRINMKMESDGSKTVYTLVIDATSSYVLTKEDIADLVSILRPYMPPATRG